MTLSILNPLNTSQHFISISFWFESYCKRKTFGGIDFGKCFFKFLKSCVLGNPDEFSENVPKIKKSTETWRNNFDKISWQGD